MMRSQLVVGATLEGASRELASGIRLLPANVVTHLAAGVDASVRPFLPPAIRKRDALFGLKLTLQAEPSLAHSGWLFSRYLASCRVSGIDPLTAVALHFEGLFHNFTQFCIRENPSLLVGFDTDGAQMLEVVRDAELRFDPQEFDADGYSKRSTALVG